MISNIWKIAGIDLKVPMDIVILLLVKQCAHLAPELSRQQKRIFRLKATLAKRLLRSTTSKTFTQDLDYDDIWHFAL